MDPRLQRTTSARASAPPSLFWLPPKKNPPRPQTRNPARRPPTPLPGPAPASPSSLQVRPPLPLAAVRGPGWDPAAPHRAPANPATGPPDLALLLAGSRRQRAVALGLEEDPPEPLRPSRIRPVARVLLPARPPPRASSFSASQDASSSPTRPSPHASLSLTRDALATVVQEMEESCTSPPPSRDLAGGRTHARRRAAARADCRCPARVPWLPTPAAVAPRRSPTGRCCRQAQDPQATPRRRRGTLPPRGRLRQLHDQVPCVRSADPTQAPPGSRHSTAGLRAHLPASDRFVDGTGATIRCSPSGRHPLLPSCSARRPETLRKSVSSRHHSGLLASLVLRTCRDNQRDTYRYHQHLNLRSSRCRGCCCAEEARKE
ncbi:vegetative cell wall protein gp1-like isoform X2 [Panicum virgatum]|uniref:vegetative cell wall protein gp1-like isoform X2 n=1 Tax=Panicum virgatum TaxID=38727 RepID=UPI0019D624EE|nr:vegetative cell wall protein gp1-like isoform X2 [Panicum virgatum]